MRLKYIFLLTLSVLTASLYSSTYALSDMMCTADYAPVCGTPKLHECCSVSGATVPDYCKTVKVSCDTPPTTYSNKCVLGTLGASFLYEGVCKTETTCPNYQQPVKKEGCSIEYQKDDYGCKKPVQICKDTTLPQCPNVAAPAKKEGCTITWVDGGNGCTVPKQVCSDTPVCPVYNVQKAPDGCYYEWPVGDNGCKKPSLKCKDTTLPQCSYVAAPAKKEGCTISWVDGGNGCTIPKQVCSDTTTTCPSYQKREPKEGCYIDYQKDERGCKKPVEICKESPVVCTQEYAPICGYKEVCLANMGPGEKCTKQTKTFSNKCMMNASEYKFLSEGECKTTEPVCPQIYPKEAKEGCYIEYQKDEKGCKKLVQICKDVVDTSELVKKMDKLIAVFFEKIDRLTTKDAKVTLLESVYDRLKLKATNASEITKKVINYLLEKIQKKISSLKDTTTPTNELDDIFKILE